MCAYLRTHWLCVTGCQSVLTRNEFKTLYTSTLSSLQGYPLVREKCCTCFEKHDVSAVNMVKTVNATALEENISEGLLSKVYYFECSPVPEILVLHFR